MPGTFAHFMEREDVDIRVSLGGSTITKHIMSVYDRIKDAFIKEEEYREKMMILCKNKKYDVNKDDGCGTTFLVWGLKKGYSKIVKSLLTLPNLRTDKLNEGQLKILESMKS